ncbi:MAG TPA: nitrate- and nitrite sensing domain-containing protein [Actinocatenispora sp.]
MTTRRRSVRFRISTLVLVTFAALTPLWGYAMYLTVPGALTLNQVENRHFEIGVPADSLDTALSVERKATVVYLADRSAGKAALVKARAATDKAAGVVRTTGVQGVHDVGTAQSEAVLPVLLGQLDKLGRQRSDVDVGTATPDDVYTYYGAAIESGLRMLLSITSQNGGDSDLQSQGEGLSRLTRSRSVLDEVDARISAAITAGRMTADERYDLSQAIGAVKGSYATAVPNLPAATATEYTKLADSRQMATLQSLERKVVDTAPGHAITVRSAEWDAAYGALLKQLHALELNTALSLGESAKPVATQILIRAGVATGIGLIGLVALVIVSVRVGRGLIREITVLRNRMDQTATVDLPNLVRSLRAGAESAELVPSEIGARLRTRELDDLGGSFDRVHRVAVDSAAGESRLRQGVSRVFVNLSRRNQALLHRQLKQLDELERKSADPDQLSALFTLDHLATRMRRHAESLIILSGGTPGRGWSSPVPVLDVVRSAVTEIEDYPRVTVYPLPTESIVGAAVADVIHLLAELIENAALYSPADAPVQVRGIRAANGLVVEVEDAGVSMSAETMAQLNQQLTDPPEFDLTDATQLGLFVVGRLATRRGISVSLRPSPYGGTSAVVLMPPSLLDSQVGVAPAGEPPVAPRPEPPAPREPERFAAPPEPERVVPPEPVPVPGGEHRPARTPEAPVPANGYRPSSASDWFASPTTAEASTVIMPAIDERSGPPPAAPRHRAADPVQYPRRTPGANLGPQVPGWGESGMPSIGALPSPQNPLTVRPDPNRPKLPRRARQANLAPGLRGSRNGDQDAAAPETARSPEEARAMMSAIQQGWAGERPDIDHRRTTSAQERDRND